MAEQKKTVAELLPGTLFSTGGSSYLRLNQAQIDCLLSQKLVERGLAQHIRHLYPGECVNLREARATGFGPQYVDYTLITHLECSDAERDLYEAIVRKLQEAGRWHAPPDGQECAYQFLVDVPAGTVVLADGNYYLRVDKAQTDFLMRRGLIKPLATTPGRDWHAFPAGVIYLETLQATGYTASYCMHEIPSEIPARFELERRNLCLLRKALSEAGLYQPPATPELSPRRAFLPGPAGQGPGAARAAPAQAGRPGGLHGHTERHAGHDGTAKQAHGDRSRAAHDQQAVGGAALARHRQGAAAGAWLRQPGLRQVPEIEEQ